MIKTSEIIVNMGPQHPATHGVFRVKLYLDGEVIVKAEPIIGYLHRGIEKLAEHRTYVQFTPIVDRLDYVSAPGVSIGWVEAVEKLMGIEVPQRAEYLRVILAEFARIASHLTWLGTHALDIGVMTLVFYCFREREYILDIFEMMVGARLTCHAFRIGGLPADISDNFIEKVNEFVDIFPKYLDDYHKLLTSNQIWLKRTRNVGIISAQEAINCGFSGPSLRGSGVAYDVRKDNPYSAYSKFDFVIPTGNTGDVYDRYLVRMEEMRQSTKIIEQEINSLAPG
ncbi:MAG: NADH-quinone oxidoreductase subunit D, partial [candidate division WOR-3 bacterium]